MIDLYRKYMFVNGTTQRERTITSHKRDLSINAKNSPDFQTEATRNGNQQSFLFTRGGEDNSYNVICMPDEQLYAGDIIEAFGEKWIVTEARADATTHKTGKMHQCNHLFRFQNFSSDVIEEWGYIDQSGYSSSVKGTSQIQRSEEQVAIYLPYNENTQKIFVDKRLASHVAYDATGHEILSTYKVTSSTPVSHSFNAGDHLLLLKAVRDVYNAQTDNLELMICDYIAPGEEIPPEVDLLSCSISGDDIIKLGRTKTYKGTFYSSDGVSIEEGIVGVWGYSDLASEKGISFDIQDNTLKVYVPFEESLIGFTFEIALKDHDGRYSEAKLKVEVGNIA